MIMAIAEVSGAEDEVTKNQDGGSDNAKLVSFLHALHTNCKYHFDFLDTRCESDWGFGLLPRKISNIYKKRICFVLLIDRLERLKN